MCCYRRVLGVERRFLELLLVNDNTQCLLYNKPSQCFFLSMLNRC